MYFDYSYFTRGIEMSVGEEIIKNAFGN